MNQEKLNKWEKTRKMGILRFTLIYGFVCWGIATSFLWGIFMSIIVPVNPWYLWLGSALKIFPFMGILVGLVIWFWAERGYRKLVSK